MGIRDRLLLLVIGVAIPLAFVGVVDLREMRSISRAQLSDSIQQQAELAAIAFERWLDAQRQPLTAIAALASQRNIGQPLFADYLRSIVATRPNWIDLRIVDADNQTLIAQPVGKEQPPPALVEFLLSEVHRRHSWAAITDRTRDEMRPVFVIGAPTDNGGAVIARVDGAAMQELFGDIKLSTRSVIGVFDSTRRVLYRKQTQETQVDTEVSGSPLFASLGDKRTAVVEVESPYDGVRRVYGIARAGATEDVVVVGLPSAALYEPAQRQFTRYLLFSLLALVCAIIAALLIERGIVRPVQRLRAIAQQLGAGDLNAQAHATGGGEIGELGAAFNTMAAQLREREERLTELDRLKSEFVSSASHELRTPLTTIKTLTHVLQQGGHTNDERRIYLETIAAECDRQIDLVVNLLDLSRIEAGAFRVALERVDAREVARACYEPSRTAAATREQFLSIDLPVELPDVLTDSTALRRVLRSLVENAIKYTPDGGRIVISVRESNESGEDEVAISVTDTGCGIAPEDVPRVFEKFYRGRPATLPGATAIESPTTNETPGVGLGLYLARGIIEQLGARIAIASRVVNDAASGTTFTIFVPVWREERNAGALNEGKLAEEKRADVEAFAGG